MAQKKTQGQPEAATQASRDAARLRRERVRIQREKALALSQWHKSFDFLKNQKVTREEMEKLREFGSAVALSYLIDLAAGLVPDSTTAQQLDAARQLRPAAKADNSQPDTGKPASPNDLASLVQQLEQARQPEKPGTGRSME